MQPFPHTHIHTMDPLTRCILVVEMYNRICAWCDRNKRFSFFKDYFIPLNVRTIMVVHHFDHIKNAPVYTCTMMATAITKDPPADDAEILHTYHGENESEDEAIRIALGDAMQHNLYPPAECIYSVPLK